MRYQGSCHCGNVKFEVEGEIKGALSCNCSMCKRKGALLAFFPRTSMTLLTPEDAIGTYTFNKHIIKHRFCKTCGIHVFGEAVDPKGNPTAAINLNCLEDFDTGALPVQHYDGKSH
ncbi:MAG: GFA family protein [Pseudomonadota bacterium]